ncbi:MAG: amidase, partial [Alphaproteobacteria bacterium]|nr:amidase [Alphaproteobacteria bacterium]
MINLDITTLAPHIARRDISPVELTLAYLDRIEAHSDLNAYISVDRERALGAARRAEAEIAGGNYRQPLHGVPLAVKDLFKVKGMARTCGSAFFREAPATENATSVARLEAAGAVILGLLNLHEFAFGPTGVNPHHGSARNPWNPDCVSGGSSSGSGCATAAHLGAATLGTDTGSSIRIPASLCGVVGLKQTYGLASRHGIYPLSER